MNHAPAAAEGRTVLHFAECFLERSETFIYNYVTAHRRWTPAVLSVFRRNENEFTAPRVVTIPYPITKRDPAWWSALALETLTGRSPWHRRVEETVRRLEPGVMHAHFGQQGYALLPIKRRLGVPLVTTFYGYDMSVLPRQRKWQQRYVELFREGDLFLVEGRHMAARLEELGAPADKIQIQRIAIFVDRYPAWQPREEPTVLFVGRFREKKGLRFALEAVRAVADEVDGLRFRIVGDGEERGPMEDYVRSHKMERYVDFLGMQAHPEVLRELSVARVLIHPSVTAGNGDSEGGAPTILLEAQAVGIPIVATLHADIPNVVDPTEGGVYLSPERDVETLTRHLREALEPRPGPNGCFVRAFHDVSKEVALLEEKYERLLCGGGAPSHSSSASLEEEAQ